MKNLQPPEDYSVTTLLVPPQVESCVGDGRLEKHNAPKLFGVLPLYQIAKIYHIELESLGFVRDLYQVQPYAKCRNYIVTSEVIMALGHLTDAVVSYEFNIPQSLAAELRKHLGIQARNISYAQAARELAEAHAKKLEKGRLRRQGLRVGLKSNEDGKLPLQKLSKHKSAGKTFGFNEILNFRL